MIGFCLESGSLPWIANVWGLFPVCSAIRAAPFFEERKRTFGYGKVKVALPVRSHRATRLD